MTIHQTLSEKRLKKMIEACESEPIHISGKIQPHGYMLIFNKKFFIKKISNNFCEILNKAPQKIIDASIDEIISKGSVNEIQSLVSQDFLNTIRSTNITLKDNVEAKFDAIIHKSDNYFILELERTNNDTTTINYYQKIKELHFNLQQITNKQKLYDLVVCEVRKVTGFARVKLYKFDAHWNGTVVAESKEAHMRSYNGLVFPHSDIPKQARTLYKKNFIRLIPDILYKPIALVPNDINDDGQPIDLSLSVLRSISPVHIEYLKNMGIRASMSISIMQNENLWGLIACHHDIPYHVPYTTRMVAELYAAAFSSILTQLDYSETIQQGKQKEVLKLTLKKILTSNNDFFDTLKENCAFFLKAVSSDGLIIIVDNQFIELGITPDRGLTRKIIEYLKNNHKNDIFTSDSIINDINVDIQQECPIAGLLAAPISDNMNDYIIWFRTEQVSQVNWAGKPEKNISENETYLSPRTSFKRWQEDVLGFSKPWIEFDVENAFKIGKMLFLMRFTNANSKIDHMTNVVSLNSQDSANKSEDLVTYLYEKYINKTDDNVKQYTQFILNFNKHIKNLITDFLKHSGLSDKDTNKNVNILLESFTTNKKPQSKEPDIFYKLTNKENEVLKLFIQGYSAKEISKIHNNSYKTIYRQLEDIKIKLGCTNSKYLIKKVFNSGYINILLANRE